MAIRVTLENCSVLGETMGFDNWFGDFCFGPYAWCVEAGLGSRTPGVAPAETGLCETFEFTECSDGTWELTIRFGVDRLSACGF